MRPGPCLLPQMSCRVSGLRESNRPGAVAWTVLSRLLGGKTSKGRKKTGTVYLLSCLVMVWVIFPSVADSRCTKGQTEAGQSGHGVEIGFSEGSVVQVRIKCGFVGLVWNGSKDGDLLQTQMRLWLSTRKVSRLHLHSKGTVFFRSLDLAGNKFPCLVLKRKAPLAVR